MTNNVKDKWPFSTSRRTIVSYIILIVAIFAILFPLMIYTSKKSGKEYFKHFDKSEINGTIEQMGSPGKIYTLDIVSDSTTYHIIYTNANKKLNDNTTFERFSEPGDSVYKEKYGDTIYLYKGNQEYKYTFYEVDY